VGPILSDLLPDHVLVIPSIDQVVFRENTEGMYGGVEFFPLPEPVYTARANVRVNALQTLAIL
jgi:isocitrate/isopropylmalate dehydrogenase